MITYYNFIQYTQFLNNLVIALNKQKHKEVHEVEGAVQWTAFTENDLTFQSLESNMNVHSHTLSLTLHVQRAGLHNREIFNRHIMNLPKRALKLNCHGHLVLFTLDALTSSQQQGADSFLFMHLDASFLLNPAVCYKLCYSVLKSICSLIIMTTYYCCAVVIYHPSLY